jgi:hypothetical protein
MLNNKTYLAIVIYRCVVGNKRSRELNFQVRHFKCRSEKDVTKYLKSEKPHMYKNPYGQNVKWSLSQIMAIEEYDSRRIVFKGEEIIGFIAGVSELKKYV